MKSKSNYIIMKEKIKYLGDDIESVYDTIHYMMKSDGDNQLIKKFDIQMNRIDSIIYHVLLDFLIDNEYYILADRFFENCVDQNIDIENEYERESILSCFMTYFDVKEYRKVDYYLNKGFDISVHEPWLSAFLNDDEYSEVIHYIALYNRKIKVEKIKSRMKN